MMMEGGWNGEDFNDVCNSVPGIVPQIGQG